MQWRRLSEYTIESEHGHRITRCYVSQRVIYAAFAPTDKDANNRLQKINYRRGERVPDLRPSLGIYDDQHAAMAACSPHLPVNDVNAAHAVDGETLK